MISLCQQCETKTRQIDASVYAGDYHTFHQYGYGRQCVECGTVYAVNRVGKSVRLEPMAVRSLPPRKSWLEPLDQSTKTA